MIYQFFQPSSVLRPFIKHYWMLEENIFTSSKKHCSQRIFPAGFTELIFYYGDRYLNIDKKKKETIQPRLHFSGQRNDYYDVKPTGKVGLLAVTFKPDAARLFFNLPVHELLDSWVSIEDLGGKQTEVLQDKLLNAGNLKSRVQIMEKFLIDQLHENLIYDYRRIHHSLNEIDRRRGLVSVAEVAGEACLGTKQFKRKFADFVGINPKQFIRIVRFQYAIYNKQNGWVNNLTQLAHKCGYYDQAHFTNEFKSFTGYAPKDFFNMGEPYSDYFSS